MINNNEKQVINNDTSKDIIEHISNNPNFQSPILDHVKKTKNEAQNNIKDEINSDANNINNNTENVVKNETNNIKENIKKNNETKNDKSNTTNKNLDKYVIWAIGGILLLFILIIFFAVINIDILNNNKNSINNPTTQSMQTYNSNLFYSNLVLLLSSIDGIIFIILVTVIFLYYNTSKDDKKNKDKYIRYAQIIGVLFLFLTATTIWASTLTDQNTRVISRIKTNPINPRGDGPMLVTFDASDFGNDIKFYEWDFGNNAKGNGMIVSYNYEKIGNFNVKLKMTTNKGNIIEAGTEVIINNLKPKAVIKVDKNKGVAPLTVLFDSTLSKDPNGNIVKYNWIFPDNTILENSSVNYTFEKEGKYPITLIVYDNNGSTGSDIINIEVTAMEKPEAVIDIKPDIKGGVPFNAIIDGTKSKAPNVNSQIIQYEWNLGDSNETLFGGKINHTYTKPGKFLVTLTVTDSIGLKSTTTKIVEVTPNVQLPNVVIKTTPSSSNQKELTGPVPFLVKFDGTSSKAIGEKNIVEYQWDFGDGSPLQYGAKINYTYNTPGEYNAILTVKDSDGLYNSSIIKIKATKPIPEAPKMDLQISGVKKSFYVGDLVEFDASHSYSPSGEIIGFDWDFGDGSKLISGAKTSHIYNNPGHYKIVVKGIDDNGKSSTAELKIVIQHMPVVAKISKSTSSGQAPLKVLFSAENSQGAINKYEWDFGDGNKSTDKNPEYVYTIPGNYRVTLKVVDSRGMIDITTTTITVE